jgi:hypothetical protein
MHFKVMSLNAVPDGKRNSTEILLTQQVEVFWLKGKKAMPRTRWQTAEGRA